jgi:hypothetical protein
MYIHLVKRTEGIDVVENMENLGNVPKKGSGNTRYIK